MPHFYGPSAQTMNIHNLIHISDDVISLGAPTSQFSAFDFENSLGFLKSCVKCPTNPIAQIQRKLKIFHDSNSPNNIPLLYPLHRNSYYILGRIVESSESKIYYYCVNIHGYKIIASHPDNVCLLSNGNIMTVNFIFSLKEKEQRSNNIFLNGNIFLNSKNLFSYPLPSQEIGLYIVDNLDKNNIEVNLNMVDSKCILTKLQTETLAITLLHN